MNQIQEVADRLALRALVEQYAKGADNRSPELFGGAVLSATIDLFAFASVTPTRGGTAGQFRSPDNLTATAAAMIQSITWANLQRPLDPGLASLSDEVVEKSTIDLLIHGILA